MTNGILDRKGRRKYLLPAERLSFVRRVIRHQSDELSFCLTLAVSGARISEILALTTERIDRIDCAIVIETLKQRKGGVFRRVPVPPWLIEEIPQTEAGQRIWKFGRTTAWKRVKAVMIACGFLPELCVPKALRHAYAVEGILRGVPLNLIKRWMGHARIETTTIYLDIIGDEERGFAARTWADLSTTEKR